MKYFSILSGNIPRAVDAVAAPMIKVLYEYFTWIKKVVLGMDLKSSQCEHFFNIV